MGGIQVHDFNPGETQKGLFWTKALPPDTVTVGPGAAWAVLEAEDVHTWDHFTFENAVLGNGPNPSPAVVSFRVEWTATGASQVFDNPAQQYHAVMRPATAQMDWSARSGDYEFQSAPLASSITEVAQLGFERNGSYY